MAEVPLPPQSPLEANPQTGQVTLDCYNDPTRKPVQTVPACSKLLHPCYLGVCVPASDRGPASPLTPASAPLSNGHRPMAFGERIPRAPLPSPNKPGWGWLGS
ncbi:hypothetical protein KIL84_014567 [Mauremys mutica]|uniref:Uncharacterized protein n=1 Tax=Mauremys mutica TaxID=74926 RepID=A0A9D3XQY6_9SAUR|nr:hypothetical protein KIL84_014567 [Mauremys mutica]